MWHIVWSKKNWWNKAVEKYLFSNEITLILKSLYQNTLSKQYINLILKLRDCPFGGTGFAARTHMIGQCYHHDSTCCDRENRYLTQNISKYIWTYPKKWLIKVISKHYIKLTGAQARCPPEGGIPRRYGTRIHTHECFLC